MQGRSRQPKEAPMAAKKLPIEERALKLLKDGLSDKKVAAKVGTNPNHVWAILVVSGLRPVTPKTWLSGRSSSARSGADDGWSGELSAWAPQAEGFSPRSPGWSVPRKASQSRRRLP